MRSLREQLAKVRDDLFPRDKNPLGCRDKLRYHSEEKALRVIRRRTATFASNRETNRMYTYHCKACDGWHITKRPQEEQCNKTK